MQQFLTNIALLLACVLSVSCLNQTSASDSEALRPVQAIAQDKQQQHKPSQPKDKPMENSMRNEDRMQPSSANPFYWQYKGQPVLLLGGSVEDNLFQISDIEAHLDLLKSVGGNYVRCTMSSRDEGNVWPFERDPETGLYDLNKPGQEYWHRFELFLELAAERDIIAQFEMWDRFDFARDPWQDNPYNPKNNINYTVEESGLKETINSHPGQRESAFFRSLPELEDNQTVLKYQHLQVDKMLSISLRFGNVLYCMDNETNESPKWGAYWSQYIHRKAADAGALVQTTEMWDAHNLRDKQHLATIDHPELYSFVDLSQNNHRSGQEHWDNPRAIRRHIIDSGHVRPMNSVKIYGADTGGFGKGRDAQERFWRLIFAGFASARFHRPPSGLGLTEAPQAHIRSMRMLTDEMHIFSCEPHNDLLQEREENEAYCIANPGVEYAVFFPNGGEVILDVLAEPGKQVHLRWLDILKSEWSGEPINLGAQQATDGSRVKLSTPVKQGYWAVLIKVM